jgi:hypothetical protein
MRPTRPTAAAVALTSLAVAACSGGGSGPATPAPTVTLNAQPSSIASGASALLSWTTTGATACTGSRAWAAAEPTSGTASTGAVTATSTYTLTCTGGGGSGQASATVTVVPPPTVTVTAAPSSVASGESAMLSWNTTNATSCAASGGWSGPEPTSGTLSTGAVDATTTYTLTCTGIGGSGSGLATVTVPNPNQFLVTPRNAALTLGQSQQFTAAVPGAGGASWSVDGVPGGSPSVGTISPLGLYTPPGVAGTHVVVATSAANPAQSGTASVAVTDLAGVYTYHNDAARTGQNLQEYALTPATVSGGTFGKQWACPVDGDVYAQPLYIASLPIAGGAHNVVIVATQHDSVYAFDADSPGCVTYWHASFLANGATSIPQRDTGCTDIPVEYGITGTPVIDPASQTIYLVANTKEGGSYFQRLHALSLATGAEQAGSPVAITASVTNSSSQPDTFQPLMQNQRAALALSAGGVYIGWASHCDQGPYWGWLMRYDAASLAQTAVLNTTPNGSEGGIWMSGGAPAIDASGSVYVTTGNGTFDDVQSVLPPAAPANDFAMSFLRVDPSSLAVKDFYAPSQEALWSDQDLDISSAGVLILPDGAGPGGHPNVLVGSDKQAHLWLIDRTAMSEFNPTANNALQMLTLPYANGCAPDSCVFATAAYYAGTVYVGIASGPVMALPLVNGEFVASAESVAVASSASAESYGFPSPTPMISASPAGNAIVWVMDTQASGTPGNGGTSTGPAILRAYDATNLATTLYRSSASPADTGGNAVKFTVPVVANGHVYVGGRSQLTVYGLAP